MKITKFFTFIAAIAAFAVACDSGENQKNPEPDTNLLTIEAEEPTVRIDQQLGFTVKFNGEDVTSEATIYNLADNSVVENPFTAPSEVCEFQFYATYGFYESEPITVEVVTGTDFNHRILLVDHTGTGCPNCPFMMNMLKALSETNYHKRYNEAIEHSYNGSDPASSDDAYTLFYYYKKIGVTGYPNLTYNFNHDVVTGGNPVTKTGVGWLKAEIDKLWKPAADAGIKASSKFEGNNVVVDVEVTSKVEQNYHITAWLLEDNIYGRQSNAKEEWQNTHNNAVRRISAGDQNDLSGEDMGTIAVDGIGTKQISIAVDSNWNRDNLKVLIIISAPSSEHGGKYEVVNTAVCPANGSIDYEYR